MYCDQVTMISSAALLLLGRAPAPIVIDIKNVFAPLGAPPAQVHPPFYRDIKHVAAHRSLTFSLFLQKFALVVGEWMVVEMKRDEGELMLEVHRAVNDMLMHCVATPKHGYQEPHTDKIVQALADLIYYSEEHRHLGPAEAGQQGALL